MDHKKFSVVIPTYTGADTIPKCFDSILDQKSVKAKDYEVIVVIDGPSDRLSNICKEYRPLFVQKNINFIVKQFNKNKGRFVARMEGALTAKSEQILFLDDRITFNDSYFNTITRQKKEILIPNVFEKNSANFISRCLYLLRRAIYGKKKFGAGFNSYFITAENFEASPKGTTSLWVGRKVFIDACKELQKQKADSKYTNEDTKLFKIFIKNGTSIYKSNEAVIYYEPRSGAWEEVEHIYQRGPRFVDYYIKPGTRFFPLLIASGLLLPALIFVLLVMPSLVPPGVLFVITVLFAVSVVIKEDNPDILRLILGIPIIFSAFLLGLYRGLFIWFINKFTIL